MKLSSSDPQIGRRRDVGLKPDVARLLDGYYASGVKAISDCETAQEARDAFNARMSLLKDTNRDAPVGNIKDTTIPGRDADIKARLYWPPAGKDVTGIVLFFHGGGYVIGNIDTHDNCSRTICNQVDAIVVSVEYRKAPEHPFPAAVRDAVDATLWVCDHASELTAGATVPIAVSGVSSGGNLAAVSVLEARDQGLALDAQVLIYPELDSAQVYDSMIQNADGFMLTRKDMDWFHARYCPANDDLDRDPRRSPIYASNLEDLAPAIVVTAEFDPLRDEGIEYATRLARAGNRVALYNFEGTIHGFFGFGDDVPSARRDVAMTCSLLREQLSAAKKSQGEFGQ